MIEETYAVQTADGAMETFLVWLERERPTPAVFLLMDAPGVREGLKDMARRLATSGYFVALPNLYYRAGNNPTFGPTVLDENSPEWKRMRAIRTKMTIPPVMNDLNALFEFAKNREEVSDGPMGCHGYCMSGPYALAAAARFPDQIGAAASFYGTWLVNDAEESPHGTFSKTNAEDVDTKAEDHAYDALRYMLMTRMTGYVSIHKTLNGIKSQVYQMQDQTFGY